MASTSTSYSLQRHGFIRVENEHTRERCDYPLYGLSSVSSAIDVATEKPVVENDSYNFSVLVPSSIAVAELSISVNGADPITTTADGRLSEIVAGQEHTLYRIQLKPKEKRPFLLTYGFARIEVVLSLVYESTEEFVLTTKDIPCLSNEDYQAPMIAQMLNELLDVNEETVARWMFTGNEDDRAAFSILDAALRDNSPKSLSSIIQLFEAAIAEYENAYDYFRAHGFSRVVRTKSKLPPRKIRRTGSHELLWMSKNSHVLSETPYETSINYLGRYYMPREIETDVRKKSYDSYENRLVLGFLGELLTNARVIYSSLKDDVASIRAIEERLNPISTSDYSLPALTLIRQCAARENYYIAKLQDVVDKLLKLKRKYVLALPGVKAVFSRAPRRTKVFQEVKCYSGVFEIIQRWLKFGDFTLARENLALHTLRLDKLYEYFVLFRLLCWLQSSGFDEDDAEGEAIEQATFSLISGFYRNEKQVSTLYKLSHGETHIRLYYQPVIYGDEREENGITLHRLSCRNAASLIKRDSYWTPDFLLMVAQGTNDPEWHIFDAKFSKASILWGDYPKDGPFTSMVSKYKTVILGSAPSDRIVSLWLFCGREPGRHVQFAETSSWATSNYARYHSGIGALTPSFSCLEEILCPILGLEAESQNSPTPNSSGAEKEDSSTVDFNSKQASTPAAFAQPNNSHKANRATPANKCLPLISELVDLVEDSEQLFKSRWAETNLGLAHPLLRKTAPKGRESRFYTKAQVRGITCYAYSNWLPNYENKLRSFVEKNRQSN